MAQAAWAELEPHLAETHAKMVLQAFGPFLLARHY